MPVIEVRIARRRFADTLGSMRHWLDQHGAPIVRFETASAPNGRRIIVRTGFDDDVLAEAFRQEFAGNGARERT